MARFIRRFVPQRLINTFKHKPTAIVANIKYRFPSRRIKVIGVTGTDGKTTTVNMIYKVLKEAGKKVSMVSTINAVVAGKEYETGFHVTSPSPLKVQQFLAEAAKNGDEYMILEVTSHALDQHRFGGVKFEVGVVTNITHDHLDYHGSWDKYFKAKAKLIRGVKLAILNRDEKHFSKLVKRTRGKVVSFGFENKADFNLKKFPLQLRIPGRYNLLNGLAAAAVCSYLGIKSTDIKMSLSKFDSLPGRMQEIKNDRGVKVVVDFAHTPNGLEQALRTLRGETKGKLIAIFGSAGERDEKKRPLMGEIAQRLADVAIITSEDPRGQLIKINEQIVKGSMKGGGKMNKNLFVKDDRQDAINFAINDLAKRGDTVGVFGKGHEKSINLDGKKEIAWSDEAAVLKAFKDGQ